MRGWRCRGNAATARHYSGINILILWAAVIEKTYAAQNWLTFRQAINLGGAVRKGERGTTVVFADKFVPQDERDRARREGDEPEGIPFLKRFAVFNVEQCDGLPDSAFVHPGRTVRRPAGQRVRPSCARPGTAENPARRGADRQVRGNYRHPTGTRRFITRAPTTSRYHRCGRFGSPTDYYATMLHELAHWTGHESRLHRDLSGRFGSQPYAREELVAEMGAAFVCASLDIVPTVRHADYIGSWLAVLREDNRAIFRAASQASRASDFLLAFQGEAKADAVRAAA